MRRRSGRRLGLLCAAGALVAATALPTAAQTRDRNQSDVLEPPSMGNVSKNDSPLPRIGVAIVISLIVIGVNLIPSKRGHQD